MIEQFVSYDDSIAAKPKVLVDFQASWCTPCKAAKPVLEKISKDVPVVAVDVDAFMSFASQYGIVSIPAYIMFEDGSPVRALYGKRDERELRQLVEG